MSFDFTIPVARDDLLQHIGVNQYSVEEVFPVRLLPGKLQDARNNLRSKGPVSIQTSFDTFFSIIKHFHSLPMELREDSWEMLVKMPPALANSLVEYLESSMEPLERPSRLNTLKMMAYLLCQFLETFEAEATKPSTTVMSAKGRKKAKSGDLGSLEWEIEKERALRGLLQMLQLPVHRLWDPPVVEEEFVNMVTCSCYKLLENPGITKAICKSTRDTIFQLLGLMVKKYNHGLGCGLKILQLLQHFEHLSSPMAQCIEVLVNECGVKTIVSDIMREIGRMDPKDLARDTSGTRAYAAFLVEMAEKIPAAMLPNISVLISLLDGESYTMRNSVLGVLGELVIRVLSKEGLDSKQKLTRDQFLDKLEDHIHDVNAFTRSKTLQIWHNIAHEKAIPLPRQHSLLELTIGRLQDKSSQVRKYAIQLIIILLKVNPFAAKLPVEELKANYEKEKEKLEAMIPEKEPETPQAAARREVTDHWQAMESDLLASVKSHLEESPENPEEEEDLIGEEENIERVKSRITQMLKHKNMAEAIRLYGAASQSWPTDPVFVSSTTTTHSEGEVGQGETQEDPDSGDQIKRLINGLKSIYFGELLPSAIIEGALESSQSEPQSQNTGLVNEITKQQVLVQYLKDSLNFASAIQEAVPVLCQLLGSKNVTDVMEAVDFFVTSFEFGLSNVMVGIRRMLVLVWSKEASVKEAVVEAYRRLYLHPQGGNSREKAVAVATNLTALTLGSTMGDLTSLEELVREFVKSGDLDKKVIQVLWERFALKIPNTTPEESRGALSLLGMAAGAEKDIVASNVEVLVKEGLGPRGEADFLLTREVALALYKLGGTGKAKAGVIPEPFRFDQNHEIFTRLTHILSEGVSKLDQQNWLPMAEQGVNVIYKLAEHPDVICGDIIKRIAQVVMSYQVNPAERETPAEEEPITQGESLPSQPDEATTSQPDEATTSQPDEATTSPEKDQEESPADPMEEKDEKPPTSPQASTSSQSQGPELQCPSGILTRLLFLAGHIALRQLVHLDVAVFGEMKRRHALQEEQSSKPNTNQTVTASAMKRNPKIKEEEDDELGMAGAIAEDAEAEFIRKLTETEIVSGTNLLAVLRPLIVAVCSNQARFSEPELRAAASLALAKYMMVSSEFCDSHLQLLFTILEKSSYPVIRANTIIALGDLSFRFPNLIEPWTPNLYARLRDTSPTVRKNTLMVLSHLILNDMVKVKGQISELATCIVDDDCRIAGLSKLFFNELAKKGNAIYNIMPDMVSRLSDPDVGVSEEQFRIIMRYLFAFIQKDRQCESLVEKLCHRFRATINQRQWRDLAFCLSMLSYSEKSIRKLQENFACFSDKVADEDVYGSFITIINSAKKFAKPEAKVLIDELEERLEKCHSKGREDEEATHKASKAAARAKGKGGKTLGRKGRSTRTPRKAVGSDGDREEDEEFHPAKRASTRPRAQRPKLSFSSDEEGEDDDLFKVDSGPTEEGVKVPSDNENINPNITGDVSPPLVAKKCRQSVNNTQKAPVSVSTPTTRKSSRKAAVKYK